MNFCLILIALLTQQAAPTPPAPPAAATAAAPAEASPVPADESWLTGSVDLGYRWVGVGGSFNTYRSIVDLGSGPKLLGTEFTLLDPKKRLFDRLDVRAYNWGDDPYETLHVDAKKAKFYDFSADYRNIAYYNNLPSFADPLLGTGAVLNEQSLDTRQRMADFRLDLLPGHWFVPYLAYDHDSSGGTGIDTFVTDGDEYPVENFISNSTNNYRGGVRIELSRIHLTIEQGGTTYSDGERTYQNPGPNFGNFTSPLLGQTQDLTSLAEAWNVRGTSIYSKGLLAANITSWLDFYGQFLYSQPSSNTNFTQNQTGNNVVLSEVLFYTAGQSLISSVAKEPHTSASLGAEIRPLKRLRVLPSWLTDRMHTTGADVTQQMFTTAGGVVPMGSILSSVLVNNYNQAELNVMYDVTKKFTARVGYRYIWGNASDVILPIAELAGLDQGKIRRNVYLAGFTYRPFEKLSINADFEDGTSGSTYFSTSLYNYQKGRVRARYQVTPKLSLSASATALSNINPAPGINYNFATFQESASFLYMPGKNWDVQGGYTRSILNSNINYLDPEFLTPQRSVYNDNSNTATALVGANIPLYPKVKAKLSFGGSLFISTGSNPTKFYQPIGKLSVPFHKNVAWVTEWRYYGFEQSLFLYQGFRSQMVTTGVRLTR